MTSDREIENNVRDQFDNSFEVPLSAAKAWPALLDIRRIASCIPCVEWTKVVDERTYYEAASASSRPPQGRS